ncbi:L,D-transpeptidase family protein [bacterium]|nr:L,D-transpeptidase family protein [bacterium]
MLRGFLFFIGCMFSLPVWAEEFAVDGDLIGEMRVYTAKKEDNLYEVARKNDIGIVDIVSANPGVDVWMPAEGTELLLTTRHVLPPGPRKGIVINLPELRLFYYEGEKVYSFPIGIGRESWRTPVANTKIVRKREKPVWTPPASIRKEEPDLPERVEPGEDNPLGDYALDLGLNAVLIHGTNRPYGVGKRSSHGCIRLYPEDIATLFSKVQVGTPVRIIDQPYKLGWQADTLYLEVTQTQEQTDVTAEYKQPENKPIPGIYDFIMAKAGDIAEIDWDAVEQAVAKRDAIPVIIGKRRVTLPNKD